MPIQPTIHLRSVSDEEFAVIDKAVITAAYAVHNKFGRLFDERIYENDLAARLRAEGFDVQTQVPVVVTHGGFEKTYFLDLIVNHMLYELKVAARITGEHESQSLHYAMLQDVRLVKVLNFGESKVGGRLLFNAVTSAERYQPKMRRTGLRVLTPHCERLVSHLKDLVHDWGTHLSSHLYNEALIHHFGGEEHCLKRMELWAGENKLGTHPVQFYAQDHAFVVTSLSRDQEAYQRHLDALLSHIQLKAIQWINLNRSRIEITTLEMAGE
jgi:GxxExxY protein